MSKFVTLHGFGGSGSELNFEIKAYSSEEEMLADTPMENTIGVITTTTMTKWVFSATEPKEPEVGMVWINIGTSSNCEFNALKNNTLQVYPLSAKQYVGGVFTDIVAYGYQGEEWVEWLLDVISAIGQFTTKRHDGTGDINVSDGKIYASTTGTSSAAQGNVVYFSDIKFDLSKYKTLTFHLETSGTGGGIRVSFFSANTSSYPWDNDVASIDTTGINVSQDFTLDVSAVNSQVYFGIGMYGYQSGGKTINAIISNVKLVPV